MNRFLWLGLVVLVVVVLWTGAWFAAASVITSEVKSLETADGQTVPRVTCESFGVGGYPFGLDVSCTRATISASGPASDVTVSVAGLKATAQIYNPFHVLGYATSPIEVRDTFSGSSSRLDFSDLEFSARMNWFRIARISLIGSELSLNDTVLEDRLIASAQHFEAHLVDLPEEYDAARHLVTLAQFVTVKGLDTPSYQIANGTTTLESKVSGLSDDVRLYGEPDAARRWQEAGGVFTLGSLRGEAVDLSFDSSGTLRLDAAGWPDGQFKSTSKGVVERLGLVVPEIVFPKESYGWLFGAPAEDGTYNQMLTFKGGILFGGLVPISTMNSVF